MLQYLQVLFVSFSIGFVMTPIERFAFDKVDIYSGREILEESALWNAFSGFRVVIADIFWLMGGHLWEKHNIEETETFMKYTVYCDPDTDYYWINTARTIAFDLPVWDLRRQGKEFDVRAHPAVFEKYAFNAIDLLKQGIRMYPTKSEFYATIGHIYLSKLKDFEKGSLYYNMATRQSDAPYHLFRYYGELLVKQGKYEDALYFLRAHYEELPDDDPEAFKNVVLKRILYVQEILKAKESGL